jgi:hypothetical protein
MGRLSSSSSSSSSSSIRTHGPDVEDEEIDQDD